MNKGQSVPLQPLQYEPLSSEEPCSKLLGECHLDLNSPRSAEEGVLLVDDTAAEL